MKKCISFVIVLVAIFHFSSINSFAQSGRVIEESEVKRIELKMFYSLGKFNGYLIFYDKEANQCAVNLTPITKRDDNYYVTIKPTLLIDTYVCGTSTKELTISPDRFDVLTLKGRDQIYAYEISFLPPCEIRKREKVRFTFIFNSLRATAETEIWEN